MTPMVWSARASQARADEARIQGKVWTSTGRASSLPGFAATVLPTDPRIRAVLPGQCSAPLRREALTKQLPEPGLERPRPMQTMRLFGYLT